MKFPLESTGFKPLEAKTTVRVIFSTSLLIAVCFFFTCCSTNLNAQTDESGLSRSSSNKSPDKKLLESYETSPTAFTEYKKDILAFSKRALESHDYPSRLDAVLDLSILYYNIRTDQRYATSKTLQGYTNRINYRLNQTKKAIEKDEKRAAENESESTSSKRLLNNVSQVTTTRMDDDEIQAATIGLSDQMMLMSQANGGPHHLVEYAGGYFGGIMQANADDLIELIEAMINPESWENNGGVGGIRYWSQSMVLVVRATTEVHEDLERFLNMLRSAR